MRGQARGYKVKRLPLERLPQVELLRAFAHRPAMHGLLEVDVHLPRELLSRDEQKTGHRISFTAFLIACLARAVDENKEVQALRRLSRRLVVFDEVDVATLIEVDADGTRVPLFHVVRDAAHKTLPEIHDEVRKAQAAKAGLTSRRKQIRRAMLIPKPIRALMWRALGRAPKAWKRNGGTVVLTSVGMFGAGLGWGFSMPVAYPLGVTVGGIGERTVLVNGASQAREHLSLTITFDHTIVDGAPATRFAARFKDLIEAGWGLPGSSASA